MSNRKYDGYHQRYVNSSEKASQRLASQQLWQLAWERSVAEQVPSRSRQSPFRAYHEGCGRADCAARVRSHALDDARVHIITLARLHVGLSRM